jgi:hypothetical protein
MNAPILAMVEVAQSCAFLASSDPFPIITRGKASLDYRAQVCACCAVGPLLPMREVVGNIAASSEDQGEYRWEIFR